MPCASIYFFRIDTVLNEVEGLECTRQTQLCHTNDWSVWVAEVNELSSVLLTEWSSLGPEGEQITDFFLSFGPFMLFALLTEWRCAHAAVKPLLYLLGTSFIKLVLFLCRCVVIIEGGYSYPEKNDQINLNQMCTLQPFLQDFLKM